jgi:hypothetical protein
MQEVGNLGHSNVAKKDKFKTALAFSGGYSRHLEPAAPLTSFKRRNILNSDAADRKMQHNIVAIRFKRCPRYTWSRRSWLPSLSAPGATVQ